jgi:hypothetical protein
MQRVRWHLALGLLMLEMWEQQLLRNRDTESYEQNNTHRRGGFISLVLLKGRADVIGQMARFEKCCEE